MFVITSLMIDQFSKVFSHSVVFQVGSCLVCTLLSHGTLFVMNARRIRCQADLKSFTLGELEETTGMPPYYVDEDYPAGPGITEHLFEATDVAQNRPLWRMMSMFGAMHS